MASARGAKLDHVLVSPGTLSLMFVRFDKLMFNLTKRATLVVLRKYTVSALTLKTQYGLRVGEESQCGGRVHRQIVSSRRSSPNTA